MTAMRCSLFGKVASKRDFVAVHAPRQFLDVWEPWLQGGMSASRQNFGADWQAAYLKAPIWRFWLGEELCGTSVIGAFMPSVDGVGRYFPLTVFACADDGVAIPPPELDMQTEWFAAIEDFLLATLDHGVTFETIAGGLDQLAVPFSEGPKEAAPGLVATPQGMVGLVPPEQSFSDVFGSMRLARHAKIFGSSTFWWTIGGEGFRPIAMGGHRMPDPFLFAEMLTGRFAFAFE